jgi:hypothetical protein
MRDSLKFLFGGYWSDGDSNAVGGRATLVFVWLMLSFTGFSIAVIALALLGY